MPIYEYWCPECRSAFEKLRSMQSNDAEVTCPRCGSKVKRMLSVVAAVGRSSGEESYASGGGGCGCGGNCSCGRHN
jgi:putative FmdB family regulatory protein